MAVHTTMQVGSRWIWRDETHSLESTNHLSHDRMGRRRAKATNIIDPSKRLDRGPATPSLKSYGVGRGTQSRALRQRSPKHGTKSGTDNFVELEDVKALALDLLSEEEFVTQRFESLYVTEQFDEFSMWLLNYFQSFNEKLAREKKANPMYIEPSIAEKKYQAEIYTKMMSAQKQLGQAYGVLLLGIGIDQQHHMACGMSRVSATYKDRDMYESLYSFCTYLVWITFKRKDYELIKEEIGRILRSNTFNPAIRVKNAPDAEPLLVEGEKTQVQIEKKVTPAEYRRIHGKRPAIKSIINQRSPALVSILPQPSEASHWLFKRSKPLSASSLTSQCENNGMDMEATFSGMQQLNVSKFKIGIIGEPKSHFNMRTLTPLGTDNEDEENDEEKEGTSAQRESQIGMSTATKKSGQTGMSRQLTAISQVTTEALSDED